MYVSLFGKARPGCHGRRFEQPRHLCLERIGRVLDNDALDNETCLETLRKVARIYQEEMGMPLNGNRFLDMPTRRFVRRMQRETGGDEEDWDDPT